MSDLDFDFSDISGKQELTELTPEKKQQEQKQVKAKAAGITLTFLDETGSHFVGKDIADCTSEEFVRWAAGVYPSPLPIDKFKKLPTRMAAFRDILKFHVRPLFPTEKEQEKLVH